MVLPPAGAHPSGSGGDGGGSGHYSLVQAIRAELLARTMPAPQPEGGDEV